MKYTVILSDDSIRDIESETFEIQGSLIVFYNVNGGHLGIVRRAAFPTTMIKYVYPSESEGTLKLCKIS